MRRTSAGRASASRSRLAADRTFERRVLQVVRRVPVGRVVTYGTVARLAGRPGAARAVGNILGRAREAGVPYHRVIAAGGKLGGYSSLPLKRALLQAEGLTVTGSRVRDFSAVSWPKHGA